MRLGFLEFPPKTRQVHLLFACAIDIILVGKAYRVLADIQDGLLNWILQKLFLGLATMKDVTFPNDLHCQSWKKTYIYA